jgi:ABC-type polysaccharide/polyol phosphate transport system ATPase subunit
VFLNGSLLGMRRREIEARMADILAFSELGAAIDAPARTYSAGMRGRLGFAIAIHLDPDVLLLDEVLGVGDAAFRQRADQVLDRFHARGRSMVIASHDLDVIRTHATRVAWLERGRVRADGPVEPVLSAYRDAMAEASRPGGGR